MDQFFCTQLLIGEEKMKKLKSSFVTVVGLGAVGSYAAEVLARFGVGRVRLVDFDVAKESNLNRHLWALHSTLGQSKAELGKKRILDINPSCQVEILELFAAVESAQKILFPKPDILVDAIDSLNPKAQILKACVQNGIPVVSSMGAALTTDPFSIRGGDIREARGCPLAERLRKRLRREGIQEGIYCVYSGKKHRDRVAQSAGAPAEAFYERGRARNKLGSLPSVTGMFGLFVGHCAVERLCGGFELQGQ